MFGLGKYFKKNSELIAITNNISETMLYIHKVILSHAKEELPKNYWDQDYICSFYCTLIDYFTEKLTKSSPNHGIKYLSSNDNLWVLKNVMSNLNPDYLQFTNRFIHTLEADYNTLTSSNKELDDESFANGATNAMELFYTFEGIPLPAENNEMPYMKKAREISSNMDIQFNNTLGSLNENQRVAMALVEVYFKDFFKNLKRLEKGNEYIGKLKDGKAHGQGTYNFVDGRTYVGEWKDGKRHGQGNYTYSNGDQYIGNYKNGNMHGQGNYTFSNGEVWEGEWKDDEWVSGKKYGIGEYINDDENIFPF